MSAPNGKPTQTPSNNSPKKRRLPRGPCPRLLSPLILTASFHWQYQPCLLFNLYRIRVNYGDRGGLEEGWRQSVVLYVHSGHGAETIRLTLTGQKHKKEQEQPPANEKSE